MKQCLMKALKSLKSALKNLKDKVEDKFLLKEEYHDLAPIDNITNGEEYLRALHWAIKNKRVKNIALTGPYGAGKSSIINSYLKQHPIIRSKHIRISMATFIENESSLGAFRKIEFKPEQIEEGILKQLFYKVNHRKIPQSRYRKLHKVNFLTVFSTLVLIVVVVIFFAFVFAPEQFEKYLDLVVDAGAKFEVEKQKTLLSFGGIILLLISILAYFVRQVSSKMRIHEIKIKDTTVSRNEKNTDSIFNKNMDEIFYFFEETRYSVVFFEDLDRFDSAEIFVQLRELNTLLNNSNTIKRPIVFVYAVKDDIFTEKDRTKFFDFIIPVIPVINSTNSGDILLDLFKEGESESFKHDISLEYILDVSLYISDMRVLQNIYNEFVLYKKTLSTGQGLALSDKIMLSLMIFKNLYPKDFADLQMESGIVKQAFEDKQAYIQKKQKAIQKEIDALVDVIANVNKDSIKSKKELKMAMLGALVNWEGSITYVGSSNGPDYDVEEILDDSFDMKQLCTGKNWYAYYRKWGVNSPTKISISNFVDICTTYNERSEYIDVFERNQLAKIQEEAEALRTKMYEISKWSVQKLIESEGDDAVFSDAVKRNKLLVFMLRKGYIDEKYVNHVNYFKGSSITTDDMNFVLGVKNHKAKPFDYTINKVAQVVNRLLPHEFEQKEALNFDVLEHMLETTEQDDKLLTLIRQLSNGTEMSWRFIDEFVERTSQLSRFIHLLASNWNNMWKHIYNDTVLTYDRKTYYLTLLFNNVDRETLLNLSGEDKLITRFIEEHDDILQKLSDVETEKMVSIIPALSVSFTSLKIDGVDSEVLSCIFDNCFYAINPEMIRNIVAIKDASLLDQLETKNYTTVIALGYVPLIEYIQRNLPFYIDNIILDGRNRKENINQIIDLIERSITDTERCKKIILFEEFCLSNISVCCSDLYSGHQTELECVWDALLDYGKVEQTWENIDRYWAHFGVSDALINYIVEHVDVLCAHDSECLDDALRKELIQSDIKPPHFTKLLKHLYLSDFDIPLENIHKENVEAMIKEHYFTFSVERYTELSGCYSSLCEVFILENVDDFLAVMDEIDLPAEVFESLVLSARSNTAFKQGLIENYGEDLMSGAVAEEICMLNLSISKKVFDAAWEVLDVDKKKKLMIDHLDILLADDFETCFEDLGQPYQEFVDRSRRHNVTLVRTEEHIKLAKRLQTVGYITSYDANERTKILDKNLHKMVDKPAILFRVKNDSGRT